MSMCKFFKKTESEKEPKSVIACYLQKLEELIGSEGSEGNYAYRGQANTEWKKVDSGAFRRIEETNRLAKKTNPQVKEKKISKEDFISYHEKELLEPALMEGHGVGEDRPLYDLELLAKLQHHGAATCLIDFTRNFLVAMWFACQPPKEEAKEEEKAKKTNGIIFILDTSDWKNFRSLEKKDLEKKVRPILTFQTHDEATSSKEETILSLPKPSWWYWSPHGLLEQRILKQDSLFIFGQPKMEGAPLKEIEIEHKHKAKILEELERLGITERTLFKDLPGFAESHDRNKSLPEGYRTPKYYLRKGDEALQRDDFKGAMADYNEVINPKSDYNEEVKLNSDYVKAYFNRGVAKSNLSDLNGAIADYDWVTKHAPDLAPDYMVEAYFNRGNVKFHLGDHRSAIADYDRAIEIKPNDYAATYNNRGFVKADLGDHSGAIEDYDRAIELEPDFAEAYNNRGRVKAASGDHSGAMADINRAIELKPDFAEAYNNRGNVKSGQGDHNGAMADYDRAIELKSDFAGAYFNRGNVKFGLGEHRNATADYNQAIKLKPDFADAYNNRGNVKYGLGDLRGAIADYDRVIELKPDFAEAYDNRGSVKAKLGDLRGAMADINRAIELKPDFAGAYNNRGSAKVGLGDHEGAIADYDRALELKPDYANAYYNRGVAYASLGDEKKARRDYSKAKELAKQSGDKQLLDLIDKALSELDNGNNNSS